MSTGTIAKEPQVRRFMSELDNGISELGGVVEEMCKRLSEVATDEPPGNAACSEDEQLVPMARDLSSMCQRLDAARIRLINLNNRIEL